MLDEAFCKRCDQRFFTRFPRTRTPGGASRVHREPRACGVCEPRKPEVNFGAVPARMRVEEIEIDDPSLYEDANR